MSNWSAGADFGALNRKVQEHCIKCQRSYHGPAWAREKAPPGTPGGAFAVLTSGHCDIVRSTKSMGAVLFVASYWYTPMVAVSGSPASVNSIGPETPS
ncbi:hypothetical protein SAMN04515669_1899 [Jiangella sp. DSM 45060]|nr:hypothetical protein SAMN04515669_1899 [Jiangella sp. DSM 45060]